MPVTSPDNIYFSDTSAPADINAVSASEATSVQAAFALRQRYEFVWANAAARTAQTGMVTSSTGYQVDTKSEYIYESAAWRLKTPYAEYSAPIGTSVPNGSRYILPMTFSPTQSTDSTFTALVSGTQGTGGIGLTISQPGIYLISLLVGLTTGNYVEITTDSAATQIRGFGPFNSGFAQATASPLRTTVNNQVVYPYALQSTGSAQSTTLASYLTVTRLG